MFQLVLVFGFWTSACGHAVTNSVSSTTPMPRYTYVNGLPFPVIAPVTCGTYRDVDYTKLDKYPTYRECMKRVARIGDGKDLSAVCVRV